MKYPVTEAVKQLQNGDADAFSEIYELTNQSLYYIILKLVDSPGDAEDILQDTYIQIYKNIGNLKNPEAFIGWATKIACNSALAFGRKKKDILLDEEEQDLDVLQECNEEFLPAEAIDNEEKRKIILCIIDSLPIPQRTVILLYYYQEMKVNEIAAILNCSEGTVKSRLNYARNAIRKAVEDEEQRSGKLYAIPLLLFGSDAVRLAMSPEKTAALMERINFGAGAASTVPAAASSSGAVSAGAKTGSGIAGKIAALTAGQKIISGVVAAALLAGVPSTVYLSQRYQTTEPQAVSASKADSGVASATAIRGVDANIAGAYLILTVRPPEDTSQVTGYSLDLLDTAHPENNLNRQCDMTGKAYIEFEAAGNYDRISVTSLLNTAARGGVWQKDVNITCTVSSMPSYTAQYSTAENMVITQFADIVARFVQFDFSEQIAGTYTTLHDEGYGYISKDKSIAYSRSDKWEDSFWEKLKSGSLYLRMRGWTYQTPISDADGIRQMSVTYCKFGPYVPIPVGNRTID